MSQSKPKLDRILLEIEFARNYVSRYNHKTPLHLTYHAINHIAEENDRLRAELAQLKKQYAQPVLLTGRLESFSVDTDYYEDTPFAHAFRSYISNPRVQLEIVQPQTIRGFERNVGRNLWIEIKEKV